MALKLINAKNQKGSALIEGLFMAMILMPFLLVILKKIVALMTLIILEVAAEDYFFCVLSEQKFCEAALKSKLIKNQFSNVIIETKHHQSKVRLTIAAEQLQKIQISRELNYAPYRQKY